MAIAVANSNRRPYSRPSLRLQDAEDTDGKRELSSLKRGLKALIALNANDTVSATTLAADLGVPRTTARRILDTLVSEGVAQKIPYETIYRLTPAAAQLSRGVSDQVIISHVASPLLYALTKDIGWTLSIVTLDQLDVVTQVSTQAISPYALTHPRVGAKLPVAVSNAGWMILAFLPDEEREALMRRMEADTRRLQRRQLSIEPHAAIRDRGYSNPRAQFSRQSVVCMPIFADDRIKACLVMQYISSALSHDQIAADYVPRLKAVAAEISQGVQAIIDAGRGPSPFAPL